MPPGLRGLYNHAIPYIVKGIVAGLQDQYDEAMFAFSTGDLDGAIAGLRRVIEQDPTFFDAQLSIGMAFYRKGDYAAAIREGHKAEELNPKEQLVHTNLSLFYQKAGNKEKAEHHGLQARIASWRGALANVGAPAGDPALEMAEAPPSPTPPPPQSFPDMPWKKNKKD